MKYSGYKRYKESGLDFIGELPLEWKLSKLKWCVSTVESGNREEGGGNQLDDGVLSLGGEHISWSGNIIITEPRFISEEFYYKLNSGKVQPSDVLLVKDGATIGKCAIVVNLPGTRVAINEHVYLMRANNSILPKFLYYFVISHVGQIQIKLNIQGAAQGGLNSSFSGKVFVPLPPIKLQNEINCFLNKQIEKIDRLIGLHKTIVELLKEKRQAIITQAITKGLDPNVPMKDSGIEWIGEIPEHWKVVRIKSVSTLNPAKSEIKDYSEDTIVSFFPMESVGDDGTLDFSNTRPIYEVKNGYTYLKNGDVVVAKITPCFENGKGAIIDGLTPEVGFGTTELIVIRPTQVINQSFLYFLSETSVFRKLGEGAMHGAAGQKRVPPKFVSNFKFGLPPLSEQTQISQYIKSELHKIDELNLKQQKMITLLTEHRASLISQAVTGKIDVGGLVK